MYSDFHIKRKCFDGLKSYFQLKKSIKFKKNSDFYESEKKVQIFSQKVNN